MGGALIPVIEMTRFEFSGLSSGSGTEVLMKQNIDVTPYTSGSLIVRLHAKNITSSTTATVNVNVYSVLPSPQDPSKLFRSAAAIATAAIDFNSGVDSLISATLSDPIGAFVSVTVEADQGASPAATFDVTISADLSMKSGGLG